ncbi:secreted RxLR effector protein 161-like [Salvia splendens]|uniref:secreted RxLR effector protein 161-like n=1 Tax=Salvia splendens TaxID=180675 RepID=UPI001C277891|nr:secreted RxLR effector protein 161-like [Salvia splendens]
MDLKAENVGILFKGDDEVKGDALVGYCDSDYVENIDSRKSHSGYIFTMYGAAVSWKSSLQSVAALPTTKAEYMALTAAVKESFWLKGIAADFGVVQAAVAIACDNKGIGSGYRL